MNETVKTLIKAKALISDPARWCQGAFAQTRQGYKLYHGLSELAASWCIAGACQKVAPSRMLNWDVCRILMEVSKAHGEFCIGDFNDKHTHEEVMAFMNEAIALAKKETVNA